MFWYLTCLDDNMIWDEAFNLYSKFPEKLLFLTPCTYMYVCVSWVKKSQIFGNFGVGTKRMIL